jgi:MFS family permease
MIQAFNGFSRQSQYPAYHLIGTAGEVKQVIHHICVRGKEYATIAKIFQPTIMKFNHRRSIPRNVWVLGFVSLLTDVSSEMIFSVLPLFLVTVLGASLPTVGWIEGIAEATASVLKVFSGALSDRVGRRKELAVFGYGFSTLVKPLFAIANSPALVLLARFGDRVGKGIRVAPRDALVADVTNASNRGAAYGLRQSLDTIGAFLGPIGATALMFWSGQNFRWVFWLAVIPGIFVILLVVGVQERSGVVAPTKSNPLHWRSLRQLGRDYWILVAVSLLFNLGNSSEAFLLLRAQQVGIAPALVPLSLVVMNVTYSLSAYPLGRLSDRIGQRSDAHGQSSRRQNSGRYGLLIGGFALYALIYWGFAGVQTPWQMWLLLGLYGIYMGMTQGSLLAIVAEQVPATLRGTAFGMMNLATGLALLPASVMAGVLWQWVSPAAAFMLGSGFAVAAIGLLVVFSRLRGDQRSA